MEKPPKRATHVLGTRPSNSCSLAQYPSGSFYKAHLDQHKGKNSRILTIILYLNDNWKPQHAGQLKFYNDTSLGLDGNAMVIEPTGGKIALFLSNDYWHEVLPSNHSRLSLTGWLTKT